MPDRSRRIYLLAVFLGTLGFGLLAVALAPRIPYGHYVRHALVASALMSLMPAYQLVRLHVHSRMIVEAQVLRMDPADLPVRPGETYAGEAFMWTPTHAGELYQMMSRGGEAPEKIQALFGGNTSIHGIGFDEEEPLFLPDRRRTHHMLITGSPGEGKSRAIELIARQVILKGEVTVILDPKGDMRLLNAVRQACADAGRSGQFRLFATPWPSLSVAYNPVEFGTPSEIADRLIATLPPATGDNAVFQGFQWEATHAVVQAMYLCKMPITIARVLRYLRNMEDLLTALVEQKFPDLLGGDWTAVASRYEAAVAAGSTPRSPELDDLFYHLNLPPEYYLKMVASFLPQLDRLTAGIKREILSPEPETTKRDILTWEAIDRQKLVVYCYLGSLHGEASSGAVGKMMLLDFQSYIACRYSYPEEEEAHPISLFVDEAHHLVTPAFFNILAEGRGAGVGVLLSTQTTSQFETALGSRAVVDQVLTQAWAHLQFQTRNPREAKDFSDLAGQRLIPMISERLSTEPGLFNSGLKNVDDFRATYSRTVTPNDAALIPPWAIGQLPTGHCWGRIGGRIYHIRIPLLTDPPATFTEDLKKRFAS